MGRVCRAMTLAPLLAALGSYIILPPASTSRRTRPINTMAGAADPAASAACSGCRKKHLRDIETLYGDEDSHASEARGLEWRAPPSPSSPGRDAGRGQCREGRIKPPMVQGPERGRLHSYRGLDQRSLSAIPAASGLSLADPREAPTNRPFPLRSWREAKLMKYYLEYMCHWFDVCDTKGHFAVHVPRKAMSCPTLLNAIFALSSRHLSLKEGHCDEWVSNQYHEHCLRQLSSVSNDSSSLLDDDLLAATILLRTLEELEVPLLGTDNEGHLMGVQLFMNARSGSSAAVSSLRQAAYWVGLRQEVTMAVASRRPVKFPLGLSFVDQSFSPADDATWANRIVVHCAKVVEFCFGRSQHSRYDHRALAEYDDGWLRSRPSTFVPIAYMEGDAGRGEVFPHIVYFSHAVGKTRRAAWSREEQLLTGPAVVGVVHSMLAQALLMCCDPAPPSEARERLMRQRILELCGTALSNESTIPAMITASLGIATCGERFGDESERRALLGVLVKTEGDHAWPTGRIQGRLKKAWGWA